MAYKQYEGEADLNNSCREIINKDGAGCDCKTFTVIHNVKEGYVQVKCTGCGSSLRFYNQGKFLSHVRSKTEWIHKLETSTSDFYKEGETK